MPRRTRPHREALLDLLRDPHEAAAYVNAALDDSEEMLTVALRNVAEAFQMSRVAEEANVSRESLYRMLSETGNPTLTSLRNIAKALNLKFRVEADVDAEDGGWNDTDPQRTGTE